MTSNPAPHTDISIIGLGAMGSTLARTLLERGASVTVWNRTAERAKSLVNVGARMATSPEAAIAASPVSIVIVLDYKAVHEILGSIALSSVADRTIVNLVTGSVADVKALAAWADRADVRYVGGGIMSYPRDIGSPSATILYSGNEKGFREHEALLLKLAGRQAFLGTDVTTAVTMYLALLAYYFSSLGAFLESTALACASGVSAPDFASMVETIISAPLQGGLHDAAKRIAAGDFRGDQATIDVHVDGNVSMQETFTEKGLTSCMLDAFDQYTKIAQTRGLGKEDISALYKACTRGAQC
jgi:3-hydroxyisobutyrate dehydrogenase-like beta-hydroxyacid dehydrogenase